jgi:hypothetical protein
MGIRRPMSHYYRDSAPIKNTDCCHKFCDDSIRHSNAPKKTRSSLLTKEQMPAIDMINKERDQFICPNRTYVL